ncbi:MAG: universal stress protein [Marmoricola sp.]
MSENKVVVGVSARSKSPTALRWAAGVARLRGAQLVAVRAWRPSTPPPGSRGTPDQMAGDRDRERARAQAVFEADVAEVLGEDHAATVRLVRGSKRRTLLDAAEGADLLVIDAPRRLDGEAGPGFLQRLLHGLDCPLTVVPRAISGAPPSRVGQAAGAVGRRVVESAGRAPRPGLSHVQPPGSSESLEEREQPPDE